jgi:hypothetical protein
MDQIVGQPWVDYQRDRLYVSSGPGTLGTQNSLWFVDLLSSGALLKAFAGGADYVTAPTQSSFGDKLYIGDAAGLLHIVDLNTLVETTNTAASGAAFKGFVWEDFGTPGRLYFVTTDGNVWCLVPPSTTPCWKRRPVAAGTVSQMIISLDKAWAGGSDGNLYQLNLGTGVVEKTFQVGFGTLGVGPVTTETGNELYVTTTDGTVYNITLNSGSLP